MAVTNPAIPLGGGEQKGRARSLGGNATPD